MAELSELEQRIKTALDRIRGGTDALTAAAAQADTSDVTAALEAEKAEKQALEDKLAAAEAASQAALAGLQEEVAQLKEALATARHRSYALRGRADEMRATLQSAREAGQEAISDPELVNDAMKAELDGLREVRDADRDELDALIAAIEPLVAGEQTNA